MNNINVNLSLLEVCAVLGLSQTVAVLVYIVSRAGHIRHIIVPFFQFFILSVCFCFDFAWSRYGDWVYFDYLRNIFWLFVPAFSVLLIRQIICLGELPQIKSWLVLLVPIILFILTYYFNIFEIAAIICSGICLISLWFGHKTFSLLDDDNAARGDRYWLIISTIIINIVIMGIYFIPIYKISNINDFYLMRDILGVALVYLASTSLFRIYPPPIKLIKIKSEVVELSSEDKIFIDKINNLIEVEKVYQEALFSRASLARELNISEARVSKLINVKFGKSVPQLINEYRVKDSLQLLSQTDAQIAVVGQEVGFNSLPTFNRVFKDIMGISPNEYRQSNK